MKQSFSTLTSTCVAMPMENIDTDQIIPARFLKATSREGFGEHLFHDWRYDSDGNPRPEFPLNRAGKEAKVLVAGKNFGCGSSREHAAWAIADYGFRAVISSFFADIHRNNELNNFVLPVTVSQTFLERLLDDIARDPSTQVTIDLAAQTVTNLASGETETFPINPYKKICLSEGLDDIDYLLGRRNDIESFESRREASPTYHP